MPLTLITKTVGPVSVCQKYTGTESNLSTVDRMLSSVSRSVLTLTTNLVLYLGSHFRLVFGKLVTPCALLRRD